MEETKKNELKDEQLEQAAGGWTLINYRHICNDCGAEFWVPKTKKLSCPECQSTNTRLK